MTSYDSDSSERTLNPVRQEHVITPVLEYWYMLAIGRGEFLKLKKDPASDETYTQDDINQRRQKFEGILHDADWYDEYKDLMIDENGVDRESLRPAECTLVIICEDLKLTWKDLLEGVFQKAKYSEDRINGLEKLFKALRQRGNKQRHEMRQRQFQHLLDEVDDEKLRAELENDGITKEDIEDMENIVTGGQF